VVIGSRFGDIFRGNSGKAGLLIATVDQDVVETLWKLAEETPGIEFSVDLAAKTITAGEAVFGFAIDDYTRHRLLEGLDDIALTLTHDAEIAAYEAQRPAWLPKTLPAKIGS